MAPSRKRGGRATAAAARKQWKVGDLVMAKMKGFRPWPATVSEPEKWGYKSDRKKLLVYFYGTKQIAFCNCADIEAFTEEKKKSLLVKRQGKGADFVRAVNEIIDIYENNQRLTDANLCDEDNKLYNGHLEGSRSKSSAKDAEINSCVNNDDQSAVVCLSIENHEVIDTEETPKSCIEGDPGNILNTASTKKAPIFYQLRQIPRPTTRKRQRDGSMQSSVTPRVPSLRRSKTSSADDPCKFQKSFIAGNGAAQGGGVLESSCESEKSGNEYLDKGLESMGVVNLNGKFDLHTEVEILKKKRKPNKKRATNCLEYTTLDKEAGLQVELNESLSESPDSHKEIVENISKADGDEHLPLVKRARVRMSKSSMEDCVVVEKREKIESVSSLEESDTCISTVKSPSDVNVTLSMVKEEARSSSLVNHCAPAGSDQMLWNVNKFQLKGITLDVEAALPPSKRLHRALEAMSANAAEATANTQALGDMDIICKTFSNSSNANPLDLHADGIVDSPMRSFHNKSSGFSSVMALEEPEVSFLTPLEVEPVTQSTRNPRKEDCQVIVASVAHCDGIQEKVLEPCSVKPVEDQPNITSNEVTSDQSFSPLVAVNDNKNERQTFKVSNECPYPVAQNVKDSGNSIHDLVQKSDFVMNSKVVSELLLNVSVGLLTPTDATSTASSTSESTKSQGPQSDESIETADMSNVAGESQCKVSRRDWNTYDLTPMKELIAAAQAKRLFSRSTSFPDCVVDGKALTDSTISPSVSNRGIPSVHRSPQNPMVYHRPATDDRSQNLHNGNRTPCIGQGGRGCNKLASPMEVNMARKSFEALLCTLSRARESIFRATRVAIDCARYGIAGEVIEILLRHLERESSFHKRVDLFFLVDSITQSSRSQKGGAGDVYLSLVQSMLPRLLSAAAPRGKSASENRRQCLKVLRLWLERKTLPEFIVRHHIRELEAMNEAATTCSYSRRPSRTERALNDPIREMEGMFVDEYGSNTGFQLNNFIPRRLLEEEEERSDDEKSFEAVTPERNGEVVDDKGIIQTPSEKHRHILEDVDGELEMEDVAPPCVVVPTTSCHVSGTDTVSDVDYQRGHHQSLPCAPPLPDDLPPSPPPLPSSPPPMGLSYSAPVSLVPQHQLVDAYANTDVSEFHHSSTHNNQSQQSQPINLQPNNFQGHLVSSESVPYYTQGYGGPPKQMPPPPCPCGSSSPYTSHKVVSSGNNIHASLPNKAYPLQPPPPTVSNQFSYIQAEPPQKAQSWGSSSSFSDRFQYVCGPQEGNFYGDRNMSGTIQYVNAERGRLSPSINTGPALYDKAETFPCSLSCYGRYTDSASKTSHGWPIPPMISNYSVPTSRPSMENLIPRVTRAPGYWQQR